MSTPTLDLQVQPYPVDLPQHHPDPYQLDFFEPQQLSLFPDDEEQRNEH